jgi:hypothetical protein
VVKVIRARSVTLRFAPPPCQAFRVPRVLLLLARDPFPNSSVGNKTPAGPGWFTEMIFCNWIGVGVAA